MVDAALQTSDLCKASAPPRPTLRYGMETTNFLICLGGVNHDGIPSRRGGHADLSFCFTPKDRKTYYVPSPLKGSGGFGQIVGGAVTSDNNVVVAVEAEDEHRMKRVDIYRCTRTASVTILIHHLTCSICYVTGTILLRSPSGSSCAQQHTGTCVLLGSWAMQST